MRPRRARPRRGSATPRPSCCRCRDRLGGGADRGGLARGVAGFTVVNDRVVEIDVTLDPEKLRRVAVD
jgi:hypothetical protein